jgi:predicted Ser/Thr protein kinase
MPDATFCPDCQQPLETSLGGLCPTCLLRQGLEVESDGPEIERGIWDPPASEDLAALFPDLDVLELIGRGGMGAVYKARQHHLERIVAVKVLPPEIGTDATFASRFAREAQAMARLNHPNIVAIHDFGRTGSICFFVMEYVDGANLRQLLANGPLAPAVALPLVMQICDALQYAHSQGIVHRDIKPDNIMITRDGQVKIADFGLAKLLLGQAAGDPALEQKLLLATGKAFGTPRYMAPEQFSAPRTVDHRADIYSLGIVIYQMLTGELPHEPEFIPLSQKNREIDPALDPILQRALEREPARRYQSMSEIRTEFANLLGAAAVAAPGEPDPRRLRMETLLRPISLQTRLDIAGFFLLIFAIFMGVSLALPAITGSLVTWFLATGLFAIPALLWGTLPYRVLGGLAVLLASVMALHDYRDGVSEHNRLARLKQERQETTAAIAKAFTPTPSSPEAWFIIAREGVSNAQRVYELIGKDNLTAFLLTITKESPVMKGGYEWDWPADSAKIADRPLLLIGRLNQYRRILNPEDLCDLRYDTSSDTRAGHFRVNTEYELNATFVFELKKAPDGGWTPTRLGIPKKGRTDAEGALMIVGK